jgi:DNA-binding transcriptional LysR family regulator
MFDWNNLRPFLEVVRAKTLTGAAGRLGVDHTTVARRIHALEEALAVRLFERAPSGYTLTAAGQQLVRLAEEVESACVSAEQLVGGASTALSGAVRISVPEGFGARFLPRHLPALCEAHPGLTLEVVALRTPLSISKREADISILLEPPSVGRLVSRPLTTYTMRIYATLGYLEQAPPVRTIEELRKLDIIRNLPQGPEPDPLEEVLPAAHAKLGFVSMNAQMAAVELGLGASLLPCYMAGGTTLAAVLPDEAVVTRTFWVAMHEDMRQIPRVRIVWEWLKDIVAREQKLFFGHL